MLLQQGTLGEEHDARTTARGNTHSNSTRESIQRNSNCVCVDRFPVSVIFMSTILALRQKQPRPGGALALLISQDVAVAPQRERDLVGAA
jgi:hypothetical protein